MKQNNEYMSLEQLYKALHISKRKAAWMLQNGIIPCEIRNTSTHKYSIKRDDVIAYLEKSAKEKRKEIPVGIFNSKPTKNPRHAEQYCSVDGGYTYTDIKLRGAERARFRRKIELQLFDLPDSLCVTDICNLTGYSPNTIKRYIRKKRLFAVMINGKYIVSKHSVVNFFATDAAFKNAQKTEWHIDLIKNYLKES